MLDLQLPKILTITERYRDGESLPRLADDYEYDRVSLFNHRNENRPIWEHVNKLCETRDQRLHQQGFYKAHVRAENAERDAMRCSLVFATLMYHPRGNFRFHPYRDKIIEILHYDNKRTDRIRAEYTEQLSIAAFDDVGDIQDAVTHFENHFGVILPNSQEESYPMEKRDENQELDLLKKQFGWILLSYSLCKGRNTLTKALIDYSKKATEHEGRISSHDEAEMLIQAFEQDMGITLI